MFTRSRHAAANAAALARELIQRNRADEVTGMATVLAYNFFMALPAGLVFLVSALAFLPVEDLSARIIVQLEGVIPSDSLVLVERTLERTFERGAGQLSLLVASLAGALYVMNNGYSSLIKSVNRILGATESRSWRQLKSRALVLSVIAALLITATFSLVLLAPLAADYVSRRPLLADLALLIRVASWPLIIALALAGIELNYRLAPCKPPRWRFVSPGSWFAAAAWIGITFAFGFYVENFGSYNKVYGTLGAVIVLLTWIWLSAVTFLVGAEMNAMWLERKNKR